MSVSVCATDDSSPAWLPTDARSGLTPRSKPASVPGAVALRSAAPRSGGWSEAAAGADCLLAPSPRSRGGSCAANLSVSSALGLESLRLSKRVRCRRLTGPAAPEGICQRPCLALSQPVAIRQRPPIPAAGPEPLSRGHLSVRQRPPIPAAGPESLSRGLFPAAALAQLPSVRLLGKPWPVAHQAPLSVGSPREEHCRGLPFPSLQNLPRP